MRIHGEVDEERAAIIRFLRPVEKAHVRGDAVAAIFDPGPWRTLPGYVAVGEYMDRRFRRGQSALVAFQAAKRCWQLTSERLERERAARSAP